MNSAEFTLKNVELAVTVYPGMFTDGNCCAGKFTRQSQNDVDISDFENIDAASSDDETLIIDPDILDVLADLPPKNQWTEHLVSSHIRSQRESLAEQYGDVTLVQ